MKKLAILLPLILVTGCMTYSLAPAGSKTVKGIQVNSLSDWNKSPFSRGSNTEVWTKDGHVLNEIMFVGGVENGKPLFKNYNKELPMPEYQQGMLPNELAELITTSLKNANGGEIRIKATDLRPQRVGENLGVRFGLNWFTTNGLAKRGEAVAVPNENKLNIIIFTAADIHYYQKDAEEIDQMFSSMAF